MKHFIKILATGILYYVIQILLEIVVNLFLEYTGIKRSEDFSYNTLFIENLLHHTWVISISKMILIWLYLLLFVIFSFTVKSLSNGFIHLFACLGSSLLVVFYDNDLPVIINFFIPVIIACGLVLLGEKIFFRKEIKA
ncbi:hypothetical protein [Vaginella massiliensis]|uniref:hypothetical protein n=1 Tax=Vaginella massiliensis TaxID=1816680 RepID=UPI000838ED76|nr:hypothetical protein [Vaginella massiliensis]